MSSVETALSIPTSIHTALNVGLHVQFGSHAVMQKTVKKKKKKYCLSFSPTNINFKVVYCVMILPHSLQLYNFRIVSIHNPGSRLCMWQICIILPAPHL